MVEKNKYKGELRKAVLDREASEEFFYVCEELKDYTESRGIDCLKYSVEFIGKFIEMAKENRFLQENSVKRICNKLAEEMVNEVIGTKISPSELFTESRIMEKNLKKEVDAVLKIILKNDLDELRKKSDYLINTRERYIDTCITNAIFYADHSECYDRSMVFEDGGIIEKPRINLEHLFTDKIIKESNFKNFLTETGKFDEDKADKALGIALTGFNIISITDAAIEVQKNFKDFVRKTVQETDKQTFR